MNTLEFFESLPSIAKIAWAAGFLEGEGSFWFHKKGKPGCGTPHVTSAQVQKEPRERLMALVKSDTSLPPSSRFRREFKNAKPCWRWRTRNGTAAASFMMTLYMLMSPIRRAQIRATLEHWKNAPGKGAMNRLKTHCLNGHPFSDARLTPHDKHRKRVCVVCERVTRRERTIRAAATRRAARKMAMGQ